MNLAGIAGNRGRNLLNIADRQPGGASVSVILTNSVDAPVLAAAQEREIPTEVVPRNGDSRHDHERRMLDSLSSYECDLVCLDGYMQILSDTFLDSAPPTLNIHPSLLPAFPGADAWGDALEAGVSVTGCTVHVVTDATDDDGTVVEALIDSGPIVTQEPVPVYEDDTKADLKERILYEGEFQAYPRAVKWFASESVSIDEDHGTVTVEADTHEALPVRRFNSSDRSAVLRYGLFRRRKPYLFSVVL